MFQKIQFFYSDFEEVLQLKVQFTSNNQESEGLVKDQYKCKF